MPRRNEVGGAGAAPTNSVIPAPPGGEVLAGELAAAIWPGAFAGSSPAQQLPRPVPPPQRAGNSNGDENETALGAALAFFSPHRSDSKGK